MDVNITNLLLRLNQLNLGRNVKWNEVVFDFDQAIEEINLVMGTIYPVFSKVFKDDTQKTYTYRVSGYDEPYFPETYIWGLVIPFVAYQYLVRNLQGSTSEANIYYSNFENKKLEMVQNELTNVPVHLIDKPKGVYFPNDDPAFRRDPIGYFNRKIYVEKPKIKVTYDFGDLTSLTGEALFVSFALPIDNNRYEIGSLYMPYQPIIHSQDIENLENTLSTGAFLLDGEGNAVSIFRGWTLKKDSQEVIDSYITLTEDVTFYAIWDNNIIPIKYRGNGGEVYGWKPSYVILRSAAYTVTPQGGYAFKRGFYFNGFLPSQLEVPAEDETDATWDFDQERIFYVDAQWEIEIYSITYEHKINGVNKGINTNKRFYIYGEEVILLDLLNENNGKLESFQGWYDNPQFLGTPITSVTTNDYGDKIFYAKIVIETATITVQHLDGKLIEIKSWEKGTYFDIATLNVPTKNETELYTYEFSHWASSLTINSEYKIKVSTNVTLTAIFNQYPKTINITIKSKDYNDVDEDSDTEEIIDIIQITVPKLTEITETFLLNLNGFSLPVVTDYLFSGFSLSNNGNIISFPINPDQNVDLYLIYTENLNGHTITFNYKDLYGDDEDDIFDYAKNYNIQNIINERQNLLTNFVLSYTSDGVIYYFSKWIQSNGSLPPEKLTDDLELYASYTQELTGPFTLTIRNYYNGLFKDIETGKFYGQTHSYSLNSTERIKTGFVFSGVFSDSGFSNQIDGDSTGNFEVIMNGNQNVYIKWDEVDAITVNVNRKFYIDNSIVSADVLEYEANEVTFNSQFLDNEDYSSINLSSNFNGKTFNKMEIYKDGIRKHIASSSSLSAALNYHSEKYVISGNVQQFDEIRLYWKTPAPVQRTITFLPRTSNGLTSYLLTKNPTPMIFTDGSSFTPSNFSQATLKHLLFGNNIIDSAAFNLKLYSGASGSNEITTLTINSDKTIYYDIELLSNWYYITLASNTLSDSITTITDKKLLFNSSNGNTINEIYTKYGYTYKNVPPIGSIYSLKASSIYYGATISVTLSTLLNFNGNVSIWHQSTNI